MADFWQIKGEAGKAMDDAMRDFSTVGENPKASFPALAVDTFSFTITLDELDGTGSIIPEDGQQITVYRNGVRHFLGPAIVVQDNYKVTVTILGAWFWLEKVNLTDAFADVDGNTAQRLQMVFAVGTQGASLARLLGQCIGLGAQFAIGSLNGGFTWPEITLSQSSGDIAVAELIRLIPDMMAWFDYSGSGLPTFNTSRRGTAEVITHAITELNDDFSVKPVLQLQVEFVRAAFLGRGTNLHRIYKEVLSGDAGTAQSGGSTSIKLRAGASFSDAAYAGLPVTILSGTGAGQTRSISTYVGSTKVATVSAAWTTAPNNTSVYKVGTGLPVTPASTHVIVVSGPELDTYLPKDTYEEYQLLSVLDVKPLILAADPQTVQAKAIWGSAIPVQLYEEIRSYSYYSYAYGMTGGQGTAVVKNSAAATYTWVDTNTPANLAGWSYVTSEEPPDWVKTGQGLTFRQVKVVMEAVYEWDSTAGLLPTWANAITWEDRYHGFKQFGTHDIHMMVKRLELTVWAVSRGATTTATAGSKKYKPQDISFHFPPSDFAYNLQQAQNFIPYTGGFSITEEEAGVRRYSGRVINVSGALAKYATMLAMVAGEDIDYDSGTTTVTLGAPPRLDYRSTIDKIRRTSQDNIVYI